MNSRVRRWFQLLLAGAAAAITTGIGTLWLAPKTVGALWFMAGVPLGTLLAKSAGNRVNYWIHPEGGGPVILAWSLVGACITWTLVLAGIFAAVGRWRQRSRRAI